MWISKIFNGRKDASDDDAEHQPIAKPRTIVAPPVVTPMAARKRAPKPQLELESPEKAGFDPYNSGTFQKKGDAWQRVTRRS